MISFLKSTYFLLIKVGNGLQPLVLLAMRFFWGWFFFSGGRDKLSNIAPIADYFHSLGIPLPELNAYIAGSIECVGGFCLMIGLAARLVSLPLMVVMIVALATAHHEAFANIFTDPLNFTQQTPFNFLFVALLIFIFGPGALSCDALLKRLFFKNQQISK
jgi:putative oxidoreductase